MTKEIFSSLSAWLGMLGFAYLIHQDAQLYFFSMLVFIISGVPYEVRNWYQGEKLNNAESEDL